MFFREKNIDARKEVISAILHGERNEWSRLEKHDVLSLGSSMSDRPTFQAM